MIYPIATPTWLRRWAAFHNLTGGRLSGRSVCLARCLRLGGASAQAAGMATAVAALYEAELARLGADVESVSRRVRTTLFAAALMAPQKD